MSSIIYYSIISSAARYFVSISSILFNWNVESIVVFFFTFVVLVEFAYAKMGHRLSMIIWSCYQPNCHWLPIKIHRNSISIWCCHIHYIFTFSRIRNNVCDLKIKEEKQRRQKLCDCRDQNHASQWFPSIGFLCHQHSGGILCVVHMQNFTNLCLHMGKRTPVDFWFFSCICSICSNLLTNKVNRQQSVDQNEDVKYICIYIRVYNLITVPLLMATSDIFFFFSSFFHSQI